VPFQKLEHKGGGGGVPSDGCDEFVRRVEGVEGPFRRAVGVGVENSNGRIERRDGDGGNFAAVGGEGGEVARGEGGDGADVMADVALGAARAAVSGCGEDVTVVEANKQTVSVALAKANGRQGGAGVAVGGGGGGDVNFLLNLKGRIKNEEARVCGCRIAGVGVGGPKKANRRNLSRGGPLGGGNGPRAGADVPQDDAAGEGAA
jgi:hypothetical protein